MPPAAPFFFLTHSQGPKEPCPVPESLLSLPHSQFSRKSLVAINDDKWLEPLLLVTMEKINNLDPFYLKDKVCMWWGVRHIVVIYRRETRK